MIDLPEWSLFRLLGRSQVENRGRSGDQYCM